MKAEILAVLRKSDTYVSGQELCQKFGVSRTAVWKAMNQLKKEGYEIEAVQNRGYRIKSAPDILSVNELTSLLQTEWAGKKIYYYDVIDSTNTKASQLAEEGAEHGRRVRRKPASENGTIRRRCANRRGRPDGGRIGTRAAAAGRAALVVAQAARVAAWRAYGAGGHFVTRGSTVTELRGLYRPQSVAEATALLAQDPEARAISGGATLVAMINAGVIEPAGLVSLDCIEEIKGISLLADGRVRIGAFTRHRETAECRIELGAAGVVRHAASQIANATVRNMGTIGGSISFADPGLDYPPALVAADAVIEIASTAGRRTVPAAEFFVDWYTTAVQPGEIVTAVLLPRPQGGVGLYLKHCRVSGDYATASLAIALGAGGVRVAVGGCGPTPIRDDEADAILSADRSAAALARAGVLLEQKADPLDDVRGSADYRRRLIARLLLSAVREVELVRGGVA